MRRKKTLPSKATRVRAIARERIGSVPPTRALEDRTARSKPKHKKKEAVEIGLI